MMGSFNQDICIQLGHLLASLSLKSMNCHVVSVVHLSTTIAMVERMIVDVESGLDVREKMRCLMHDLNILGLS